MSNSIVFETEHAEKYGVNAAILIYHFRHWIEFNHAGQRNRKENKTWTYHKQRELEACFSFWSRKQIRTILEALTSEDGPMIKGNFNPSKYDRTTWYAFKNEDEWIRDKYKKANSEEPQEGQSMCPKGPMEKSERANQSAQKGQPIPDNIPDNKPDSFPSEKNIGVSPLTPPNPTEREKHVFISDQDHGSLVAKFGQEKAQKLYKRLSDWKEDTPKSKWKKNDYRSILRWVVDAIDNEEKKRKGTLWKGNKNEKTDFTHCKENSLGIDTRGLHSQELSLGELLMQIS